MRHFSTPRIIPSFVVLCSLILAPTRGVAQNQGNPPIDPPRLFDEYGHLPWADERARLDNAAIQFQQHSPDFVMYLIAYGARDGCVTDAYARYTRAKRYLVRALHLPAERVVQIDGGYREQSLLQIWIWPRSFGVPKSEPTVDRSNVRLKPCSRTNDSVRQLKRWGARYSEPRAVAIGSRRTFVLIPSL
jgi:hypothetical protein